MKELVQKARALGGTVADAVRNAIDPPLTEEARPLDIKRAIVELVERQIEPAGSGRRILPADAVQVQVLAEDAGRRRALEAVLVNVDEAITRRMLELRCTVPRRFTVEIGYVRRAPAAWTAGQRLAVRMVHHPPSADEPSGAEQVEAGPPSLTLTVTRGAAANEVFTFNDPVVRLGRSSHPTDERGRPRVNNVAFLEDDTPENITVTRGHAMIRFHRPTNEYRLFDEGSANGTRVLRAGEIIEVPRRDPVGVTLRSGDEVQLGKASLQVRIGAGPATAA